MINKYLLIILLCFFTNLLAQDNIGFSFDYARFNYDEKSNYLEFYYSFDQKTLTKRIEKNEISVSAKMDVRLANHNGEDVIWENYNLVNTLDSIDFKYNSEELIGVLGFQIPFGKYNLEINVTDNYNDSRSILLTESIDLESFLTKSIAISDLQLCRNIIQDGANKESIYYKNGLEAIPNPGNLYGEQVPVLFYYNEIYCNSPEIMEQNCTIERITKKNNTVLNSHKEPLNFINNSIVKAGLINVSSYGTGKFSLTFNVLDSEESLVTSKTKSFYIFNPNVEKSNKVFESQVSFVGSEFGTYNEEECDYNYEISKYLASGGERDLYESLQEIDAKRKFLFEFWKKRDIFPETIVNEFKNEYMKRLSFVNSRYSHRNKKGYRTDQGRVYLIYGKPDRVETRTNTSERKPFEIWQYDNIEGGIYFVFGDTMGITEYELLHSTKRGELVDPNWERRITIKGGY